MNKRILMIIISALVCIAIFLGLNEIKSFDGYYSSIENVIAHEKIMRKGGEQIALIENASGYVAIVKLDNSFTFYSFKSKNTLTGEKYAVASYQKYNVDYDNVDETYPPLNEWSYFDSITLFKKTDEKDLKWCVVKKGNELELEDDVKSLEYSYNGTTYCILYKLVER